MIVAARSGVACACTISSKVRRMSSIIACSSPAPVGAGDPARLVAQRRQAQRLGQPLRRVDGQHHRAPAALGGPQRQRRRGGGLADAAGAAAHQHPGRRVVQQRVDVQPGGHDAAPPSRRNGHPGVDQQRGQLVERAQVDAVDQLRQLQPGQRRALGQPGQRLPLGVHPHRVLHGLGDQPVDHLRRQVEPGRGQPGADPAGVHPAVRGGRHRAVRQPLRPHPVDDHRARPQAGRGQLGRPSPGSR